MRAILASVIISGVIALAGSARAESFVFGQTKTVSLGLPGCIDLKTENQIAGLLQQKDIKGAIKVAFDAGTKCRLFKPPERVTVEGFSKPLSLYCIRPASEKECYWYPSLYLR